MIGRLLFSVTFNPSVTNLLVKQIHDCESVGISVARTVVSLFPKEMRSATVMVVCIKENETDCGGLVVLYDEKNENVRKRKLEDAQYEIEHMCSVR